MTQSPPAGTTRREALDELHERLQEVIAMLLEDGAPKFPGGHPKPATSGRLKTGHDG